MCCPACPKFPCSVVTTVRSHTLRHGGYPSPHYHFCRTAEPCDFECVPCGRLIREAAQLSRTHFEYGCCHQCPQYSTCRDFVVRHTRWQEVAAIAYPKSAESEKSHERRAEVKAAEPVRAVAPEPAAAHVHADRKALVNAPGRVLISELEPEPAGRPMRAAAGVHPSHGGGHAPGKAGAATPDSEAEPPESDTMRVQCGGCRTVHRIPRRKAGKRGRCPVCRSVIHVPLVEMAVQETGGGPNQWDLHLPSLPHLPAWSTRTMVLAPLAAVLLLVVIVVIVSMRGPAAAPDPKAPRAAGPQTPAADPAVQEKIDRLEDELSRLREAERRARDYVDLRGQERRLRAREILARIRAYEPVSPAEYEFRNQVMEDQRLARSGGADEDWRLDTPLSASESQELARALDALRQRAPEVQRDAAAYGIKAPMKSDALSRPFPDLDQALVFYAARRQRLTAELADARRASERP